MQSERLRTSLAAAEAERSRWARELHDETLQGLGALRVLLSSALRGGDPERGEHAMREAVEHIEREIGNLRSIITELRPAALDELGLGAAIEALLDRHREQEAFRIEDDIALPPPGGQRRLDPELESTVYRLVQEALMNVAKHAGASTVRLRIAEADEELHIEIQDDGAGFAADGPSKGFGLAGMQERVGLADGSLDIESGPNGTVLKARLPAQGTAARAVGSDAQQAAS